MNDQEFRVLHSQFCINHESLTIKELYALINYLHKQSCEYLETIEEISNDNEREPEPHNYKEDLD